MRRNNKLILIHPQMVVKDRLTVVRNTPWREIRIQVEVPLMDASFHHSLLNLFTFLHKLQYHRYLLQCISAS